MLVVYDTILSWLDDSRWCCVWVAFYVRSIMFFKYGNGKSCSNKIGYNWKKLGRVSEGKMCRDGKFYTMTTAQYLKWVKWSEVEQIEENPENDFKCPFLQLYRRSRVDIDGAWVVIEKKEKLIAVGVTYNWILWSFNNNRRIEANIYIISISWRIFNNCSHTKNKKFYVFLTRFLVK